MAKKESGLSDISQLSVGDKIRVVTADGSSKNLPASAVPVITKVSVPMGINLNSSLRKVVLVKTSISQNTAGMFLLELKGNCYTGGNYPYDIILQGYNTSNGITATKAISIKWSTPIYAFVYEGYLCFCFISTGNYNSIYAYLHGHVGPEGTPSYNLITSMIALEEMPSDIERLVTVTPVVV